MLEQLLRDRPTETQVEFRLGYTLFRQRKLTAARQRFASIVKTAPPAYNSRYFLARIALMENRPAEAIDWLKPVHKAKHILHSFFEEWECRYRGLDTG